MKVSSQINVNLGMRLQWFYIVLVIFFSSCNGLFEFPQVKPPAQQNSFKSDVIKIHGDFSTTSTDWLSSQDVGVSSTSLNLSKYEQIDSIIFRVALRSEQTNVRCIAELYSFSKNQPITSSRVYSRVRYTLHDVSTEDIKFYLPKTKALIGARIKSEENGNYAAIGPQGGSLIVYYQ